MEILFIFSDINLSVLSKKEKLLILSYIFYHIHEELLEYFKSQTKSNLQFNAYDLSLEDEMLEVDILNYIIRDILSTDDYTITGLAKYTRIPEDAVYDLLAGLNKNPSLFAWKKIVALHITLRQDFYLALIKKIMTYPDN